MTPSSVVVQALRLCRQAGLVGLGALALDGTKLRANASRHKAMSYDRMGPKAEQLEAEIAELQARMVALLRTSVARRALPEKVPLADAVANVAHAATLTRHRHTGDY